MSISRAVPLHPAPNTVLHLAIFPSMKTVSLISFYGHMDHAKIPARIQANSELQKTGNFDLMSLSTDQDEHSIELHLPYVRKIFDGCVFPSHKSLCWMSPKS
jgi:hypothetical protein